MASGESSEPSGDHDADADATQTGGQMLLRSAPPELQLQRGDVLAGRYQIEKLVGKGATGSVFQAFDRVVRGVVAVKVLKPELAADVRWVERLGGELRYARKLEHRNVCRVYDMAESAGVHFLTMEWAGGGSLRQRLAAAPGRPLEERIADARAVIDGLAAIHGINVIHRDIKPENVLVMDDGRLVITDLGVAVTMGQVTFFSSQIAGTPSYMAPEVVMGDKATFAADVWSLGVVLHEILFEKRPEWNFTRQARSMKPPVDGKAPRLLRGLAALCDECLQELPPRRLQDAGAVKRRFEAVVGGKWRPGRRRCVAAGAAASCLAVAAGTLMWFGGHRSTGPAIVGAPSDITRKPSLLTLGRSVRCMSAMPSKNAVRLVLESPSAAIDVDLATGAQVPANVISAAIQNGCPELSPDGTSLLYVVAEPSKPSQVYLSPRPDGSDGHPMTIGRQPHWLPDSRQFVYSAALERLEAMSVDGNPAGFPEGAAHDVVVNSAVASDGTRIAALFGDGRGGTTIVAYTYPARVPYWNRRLEMNRVQLFSATRNWLIDEV